MSHTTTTTDLTQAAVVALPKPAAPSMPDPARVPPELVKLRQWVNWRYTWRGDGKGSGKWTKVPVQPDGGPADTTDPATWSFLSEVLNPSVPVNGIGIVLGAPGPDGSVLGGIDFDHLGDRLPGETDGAGMLARRERAGRHVRAVQAKGAYVEPSPSGNGLHVLGWMPPQPQGVKRQHVEAYTGGRYFTFTGLGVGRIVDIADEVGALLAEIAPDRMSGEVSVMVPVMSVVSRTGAIVLDQAPAEVQNAVSAWLDNPADGGQADREKRARVWGGDLADFGDDHSAADIWFCGEMARRGLAPDQIDIAARASGLYRPKWDSKRGNSTYGANTIAKATQGMTGAPVGVGSTASALAGGKSAGASISGGTPTTGAVVTVATTPPIITSWPAEMPPQQALSLMNAVFLFAHDWGGEPLIGHIRPDGSVRPITDKQLRAMMNNRYVLVPRTKGGQASTERMPLGNWWLANPARREVDRVVFDPEGKMTHPGEQTFNLWAGFARQPAPGCWMLMARHLFVIVCRRDKRV